MLLEFNGYTFAAGVLECVSGVRKSSEPGDLFELTLRTRSGFEVTKKFPTRGGAEKARDELIGRLLK